MSNKKSVITRYSKGNKYLYLLPSVLLGVYQLFSYNLLCTVTDIVHSRNPHHLVFRFELFGYAFLFGELFYQPKEHILCLLVDVGEVGGEFAACQQIGVSDFVVLFDVPQMPLAPYPDFNLWLFGQLQTRQIIITLHFVVDTRFLVVNSLFHCSSTFHNILACVALF